MAYTIASRRLFGRLLGANQRPPRLARYVNALVETLIVTAIIITLSINIDVLTALNSPPSYVYLFVIMLSTLRTDPLISLFTGLACMAEYMAVLVYFSESFPSNGPLVNQFAFQSAKAVALLIGSIIAACIAQELRRRFKQQLHAVLEHTSVMNVFGRHVSPQVAAHVLANQQQPASEVRFVCVLFLDIRDFTRYAEGVAQVVSYLNTLFAVAIEEINQHKGIINKFLGDGFMAIFGAPLADPRACDHAVEAAHAILRATAALAHTGAIPPTSLGIGIHAGEVVTGRIGSSQRQEYTVIGDSVNVAARIEQLNKVCETHLLISDAVWERLDPTRRQGEELAPMVVKGRSQPVRIYALA